MAGISHFETFLFTGILLNLTPGNDTIFILSRSIAHGKKAGVISAAGIATGSVVHTVFAAFGLSMIIARSIFLFNIIKYAGAAYLLYIGCKMVTDQSKLLANGIQLKPQLNYRQIYRDAMLTNIFNPKVALFFIAFLPQFIYAGYKSTVMPFLLLGATFIATGTVWCITLAIFSSAIFSRLKSNTLFASRITKACGIALIALSLKVAFTGRK